MGAPGFKRHAGSRFDALIGVGGIGTGMAFALEGDHTLGRNESRPGALLDWRDYCKLHIIAHHTAILAGARPEGSPFHVVPLGKVGADAAGDRLLREMADAGMDTRHVDRVPDRPTLFSVCFHYPDGSGGNITTSNAASSLLSAADIDRAAPLLARCGRRGIALAAPEVPLVLRVRLLESATASGLFRVAAFATAEVQEALSAGVLRLVDLLAVNEDEAAAAAGMPWPAGDPEPFLERLAAVAAGQQPALWILLSAGARGAWAFDGSRWAHSPAAPVTPVSTAGAGDALLGALLAGLAAGLPLIRGDAAPDGTCSALDFASAAAGMSVTSPHTIHPGLDLPSVLRFARSVGTPLRLPPHLLDG